MAKYKNYVKRMLEVEKKAFLNFKKIHDQYTIKGEPLQAAFNREGAKILEIVGEWENKLCRQSEKGGYSQFTPKLAEKFREEVKKYFPMIDHIGIQVNYALSEEREFAVRKINLT